MAEFQDVAAQKKRMCNMYDNNGCNGCPLNNGDCGVLNMRFTDVDTVRRVENTVMSWAADHPEPVYPTWYEFMRENKIIPDVLEDCGDYYKTIGKWLVKATIKHDIAQKLGIEPKDGTHL